MLAARPVVGWRQGSDRVGHGVVAEDTRCVANDGGRVAAHAVDLRGAADRENTAGHVAHLVIREGGGLGDPGVGGRVVLERVSEVGAGYVSAAPAHGVEAPVGWEVSADGADHGDGREERDRPTSRVCKLESVSVFRPGCPLVSELAGRW